MYNDFQLVGVLEGYDNEIDDQVVLKIKVRKEFVNSKGEIEYNTFTVLYDYYDLRVLDAAIGKKIILKGHLEYRNGFIAMANLTADRLTILDWAY